MSEHLQTIDHLVRADRRKLEEQIALERKIFTGALETVTLYLRDSTQLAKARAYFEKNQLAFGENRTLLDPYISAANAVREKHAETAKLNQTISSVNIIKASLRELLKFAKARIDNRRNSTLQTSEAREESDSA